MLRAAAIGRLSIVVGIGLAAVILGGCQSGDPGPSAMPYGANCKSVRSQLDNLDSRGVPAKVEAARAGKKLAPAQQAEVDQYNQLLNQYLGSRCHV